MICTQFSVKIYLKTTCRQSYGFHVFNYSFLSKMSLLILTLEWSHNTFRCLIEVHQQQQCTAGRFQLHSRLPEHPKFTHPKQKKSPSKDYTLKPRHIKGHANSHSKQRVNKPVNSWNKVNASKYSIGRGKKGKRERKKKSVGVQCSVRHFQHQ